MKTTSGQVKIHDLTHSEKDEEEKLNNVLKKNKQKKNVKINDSRNNNNTKITRSDDGINEIRVVDNGYHVDDSKINLEMSLEESEALQMAQVGGLHKKIVRLSWTNDIEDLMKIWGEKAGALRWIHTQSAGLLKSRANAMGISIIAITSLVAVLSFIVAGRQCDEGQTIWVQVIIYLSGIFSIIASFVSSMLRFYKTQEKAEQHNITAKQFGNFNREMILELKKSRENRRNADEFSFWAKKELDRMHQESPPIKKNIINQFNNTFIDVENPPDIVSNTFFIDVKHE
jgi:hypothetical protein